MTRYPRIDYPGAWHHVMNRGADRRTVFRDDEDRAAFLDLLADAPVEIHAFALMGNHYHLLVRSPDGKLSPAMHSIGLGYAKHHNIRYRKDGPLWRSRFHSSLIETDDYLLVASRYIHLNPVKAALVPEPGSYRWSSYRAYVDERPPPPWLETDFTLDLIGGSAAYRTYVEKTPELEDFAALIAGSGCQAILGGDVAAHEAAGR